MRSHNQVSQTHPRLAHFEKTRSVSTESGTLTRSALKRKSDDRLNIKLCGRDFMMLKKVVNQL